MPSRISPVCRFRALAQRRWVSWRISSIVVQPFQIPSVSLTQSLDTVQRIEQTIMELPEVEGVVSRTGRSDISSDPMGVGESDIYVVLAPRDEWTTASTKDGLVDAIRQKLDQFPGVGFHFVSEKDSGQLFPRRIG